jgi:hypothetical protein
MIAAVEEVLESLSSPDDQVIAQAMVTEAAMSGVLMTRTLDDGAPYYVVNYDDVSGRTDMVTSGRGAGKTVYIYRGVKIADFDSPRLAEVVRLARDLETFFEGEPLDIEFAVERGGRAHLLQARPICARRHWRAEMSGVVESRIEHVAAFVRGLTGRRRGLFGERGILGIMPDWNPAEMIGLNPRPLALSLYRELITRSTWREAREIMGYRALPPTELMVAVGGRPYIDVRASFNSFLPAGLPEEIGERLVSAWLERLDRNPALHDKVEFEIVPTILEPGFEPLFRRRYGDLLSPAELVEYRVRLADLTGRALAPGGSLDEALGRIDRLQSLGDDRLPAERRALEGLGHFDLALRLTETLEECRHLGTRPFAVIARHGFIAETWLRALIRDEVLSPGRVALLKRSIRTISGELSSDFNLVLAGRMPRESFLLVYGHLRPGAYDILSPSYRDRLDIFEAEAFTQIWPENPAFAWTAAEAGALEKLLRDCGFKISAASFLSYVRRAVAGREYGKFVFTRHLDHMLALIEAWGRRLGFSREDLAFLSLEDLLSVGFQPLPMAGLDYFRERLSAGRREYDLGRSFKLSYLIRSSRDVFIAPQHRSEPNFIGGAGIEAAAVLLTAGEERPPDLSGRIVLIESADPGYDWIFTRQVAGLITRYGGANSHMAIRCAEYGLPAAIGCGDQIFEMAAGAERLRLDCAAKTITSLTASRSLEPEREGPALGLR